MKPEWMKNRAYSRDPVKRQALIVAWLLIAGIASITLVLPEKYNQDLRYPGTSWDQWCIYK